MMIHVCLFVCREVRKAKEGTTILLMNGKKPRQTILFWISLLFHFVTYIFFPFFPFSLPYYCFRRCFTGNFIPSYAT